MKIKTLHVYKKILTTFAATILFNNINAHSTSEKDSHTTNTTSQVQTESEENPEQKNSQDKEQNSESIPTSDQTEKIQTKSDSVQPKVKRSTSPTNTQIHNNILHLGREDDKSGLRNIIEELGTCKDTSGIQDNFNKINQNIADINEDINALGQRVDDVTEILLLLGTDDDISGINNKFQQLETTIASLGTCQDVSTIDTKFDTVLNKLDAVMDNLETIEKTSLENLQTRLNELDVDTFADDTIFINQITGTFTKVVDDLATQITLLGTDEDSSEIFNNFASLGSGLSDVSQISNALDSAILSLQGPDTDATLTNINNAVLNLPIALNGIATHNDIATISQNLNAIQYAIALIIAKLQIDPVTQALAAINNPAIITPITIPDDENQAKNYLKKYNHDLTTVINAVKIATTPATQSKVNSTSALNATSQLIQDFNKLMTQWTHDKSGPSSAYQAAEILAALQQLYTSLVYLVNLQ